MRFAPNTAADRIASRHVPEGAVEERHDDLQVVVYTYTSARQQPYALGYAGTAYRPAFHYRFASEAARTKYIADWIARQRAGADSRREYRQTKNEATHQLVCGDIVYASWGYDQTNVDFFQVVAVVSPKSVRIRQLTQTTVETGFMSGTTRPIADEFCKDAPTLLCRAAGLSIRNVGARYQRSATKWDGRDVPCSWYA